MRSKTAKACSRCQRVFPPESFYRDGSWCAECRTEMQRHYRRQTPTLNAVKKYEAEVKNYDPTRYGKLHCEHITEYTKRAIERFERKTGKEAPPELLAIHQLAKRLTDQQNAQLVTRELVKTKSLERECAHCGKVYAPHPMGAKYSRYCSGACRESMIRLTKPEYTKAKQRRYQERKRKEHEPQRIAKQSEREAKRQAQRQTRALERAKSDATKQAMVERAIAAADMRRNGERWDVIAAQLGYANASGPYNAVSLMLQIDPRTLKPR